MLFLFVYYVFIETKCYLKEINMFTKIKVWWMLRCFKKGLERSPELQALKKMMEACIERNKESNNESFTQ